MDWTYCVYALVDPRTSRVRYIGKTGDLKKRCQAHATDRAWSCYVLSGQFLETSPRSGVTYLFRKLRPTLALKGSSASSGVKILRTFCFHPIGYYAESYAGCLVPTDDVIAHLLTMRTDERRYWAKANSHDLASAQAGI